MTDDDWRLPFHPYPRRRQVVVLDDLQLFTRQPGFERLVNRCQEQGIAILATCRAGSELLQAKDQLGEGRSSIWTLFGENIVELPRVDEETAQHIANWTDREWNDVRFDGTMGSIFMPLEESAEAL